MLFLALLFAMAPMSHFLRILVVLALFRFYLDKRRFSRSKIVSTIIAAVLLELSSSLVLFDVFWPQLCRMAVGCDDWLFHQMLFIYDCIHGTIDFSVAFAEKIHWICTVLLHDRSEKNIDEVCYYFLNTFAIIGIGYYSYQAISRHASVKAKPASALPEPVPSTPEQPFSTPSAADEATAELEQELEQAKIKARDREEKHQAEMRAAQAKYELLQRCYDSEMRPFHSDLYEQLRRLQFENAELKKELADEQEVRSDEVSYETQKEGDEAPEEQRSRLNEDLEKMKKERDEAREKVDSFKIKVSDLELQLETAQQSLNAAKPTSTTKTLNDPRVQILENELSDTNTRLSNTETQLVDVNQQLMTANARADKAEALLKDSKAQLSNSNAETQVKIQDLEQKLHRASAQAQTDRCTFEAELSSKQAQWNQEASEEVSRREADFKARLTGEFDDCLAAEVKARISDAEGEKQATEAAARQFVEAERQQMENKIGEYESRVNELQANQCNHELPAQGVVDELREDLANAKKETKLWHTNYKNTQQKLAEAYAKLDDPNRSVQICSNCADLNSKNTQLIKEVEVLKAATSRSVSNTTSHASCGKCATLNNDYQKKCDQYTEKCKQYDEKCDEARDVPRLEAENEDLKEEMARLEEEKEESKEEIDRLLEQNGDLLDGSTDLVVRELSAQLENEKGDHDDAKMRIDELEADLKAAKKDLKKARSGDAPSRRKARSPSPAPVPTSSQTAEQPKERKIATPRSRQKFHLYD
jgi:chromosome segregation ATPase